MKTTSSRLIQLAEEFHGSRNKETFEEISLSSNNKVWWKCRVGHEWQAVVKNRTRNGTGCPYCLGKKPSEENNLAVKRPDLAAEWDYERNIDVDPSAVMPGTNKKYWWVCLEGHRWFTSPNSRVYQRRGCPYCLGSKVIRIPREVKSRGRVSVADKSPDLVSEWDFSKNPCLPNEVPYGSNKEIYWKCSRGHEWSATPKNRTGINNTGCPLCQRSRGEEEIEKFLLRNGYQYERQYKIAECKGEKRVLPFDFAILNRGVLHLVEFQGQHHYLELTHCGGKDFLKYRQSLDDIKRMYCQNNGIPFLEVPYWEINGIHLKLSEFLKEVD